MVGFIDEVDTLSHLPTRVNVKERRAIGCADSDGFSPAAERARSSLSPTAKWIGHASDVLPRSRQLTISDAASRNGNRLVYAVPMLQPRHKNRLV